MEGGKQYEREYKGGKCECCKRYSFVDKFEEVYDKKITRKKNSKMTDAEKENPTPNTHVTPFLTKN